MTFICPNCGEDVPDKAKACPHCGSDENTGWSDRTYLDGVDFGEDSDYEETLRREGLVRNKMNWQSRVFILSVLFLVLVFLVQFVLRLI